MRPSLSLIGFTAIPLALLTAVSLTNEPRVEVAPMGSAHISVPMLAVSTPPALTPATISSPSDALVSFATHLDRASVLAGGSGQVRVEMDIESLHEARTTDRVPTDLVLIVDHSGSMAGTKMTDAIAAANALIDQLNASDRLSVVAFSDEATEIVALGFANADNKERWKAAVSRLTPAGGTNMHAGLHVGGQPLTRVDGGPRSRRSILISDGHPNAVEGLMEVAQSTARHDSPLSTVGIGDDYDEDLMTRLADAGAGNFYWAQAGADLASVFEYEFVTARDTVAGALELSLDLPDGVEIVDAAGYNVTTADGLASFPVGSLYAGQHRRFWITLNVPTVEAAEVALGSVALTWRSTTGEQHATNTSMASVEVAANRAEWLASVDSDNWGRAVVEEEYNRLLTEVSSHVQSGDKDAALTAIHSYRDEVGAMNETVNCDEVTDNLVGLAGLEQSVLGNFQGSHQSSRQNTWAKTTRQDAYRGRKSGQALAY